MSTRSHFSYPPNREGSTWEPELPMCGTGEFVDSKETQAPYDYEGWTDFTDPSAIFLGVDGPNSGGDGEPEGYLRIPLPIWRVFIRDWLKTHPEDAA